MTERQTIEVMFTCHRCESVQVPVEVPARVDPRVIVTEWVQVVVMPRVMQAHKAHSPFCSAPNVDLWIPAREDADWIGQPAEET